MKFTTKLLAGGALALAASSAWASTCASILSSIQSGACNASCQQYYQQNHPECFAGDSTTSTTQINATTFTQAAAISNALTARIRQSSPKPVAMNEPTGSGLAAGNGKSWNLWASHSMNSASVRINAGAGRNDTDVGTTVVGGDIAMSPVMTVGVSAALDRGDGSNLTGNTNKTQGYTLAPYLGYQINKDMALDVSAGLGKGKFSAGGVSSNADRQFLSASLSYASWVKDWQITGKATFLHGEEKYSGTGASTNKVDQLRVGGQAGYWMNGFMPYLGLAYTADLRRSSTVAPAVDPLGRSAFVLSAGVNFFSLSNKVTGGIAYEQESGRTNSKNETLMANINFRF